MSSGAPAVESAGELLVVIGPPAVGKVTVGRAIAAASDFRLLHNHHVIEPLAEVFGFDHPSVEKLKEAWRREVVEEAAATRTSTAGRDPRGERHRRQPVSGSPARRRTISGTGVRAVISGEPPEERSRPAAPGTH